LYIKTDGSDSTLGWEIGGVLGDWGFAKCKDIEKVLEHLENEKRGFPVSAPSSKGIAPSSPPLPHPLPLH